MKKEIKKIQNYFKSKIESGKFKIKKLVTEHGACIVIDEKYEFSLFYIKETGNKLHQFSVDNFIILLDINIDGTIFIEKVSALQKERKLEQIEKIKLEIENL